MKRFSDWILEADKSRQVVCNRRSSTVHVLEFQADVAFDDPATKDLTVSMVSRGRIGSLVADLGFGRFAVSEMRRDQFCVFPHNHPTQIDGQGPFAETMVSFRWEDWKYELELTAGRPIESFQRLHENVQQDDQVAVLVRLAREANTRLPECEFFVEMTGAMLLHRLLLRSGQAAPDANYPAKRVGTLEPLKLSNAVEYLHFACSNFGTASLAELATLCGLSRFQFCRRFAASTGLTPSDYLLRLRVEAAASLIRKGNGLTRSALDAGFSDQAHLTRMFKRFRGITPGRYRREACG
ncbi:MAG: AraC family transcriptional regulator [Pirellulales bacterium]|nr:AraC family transcriptional regulator [Pirellulales bacterium]